MKLLSLNLWGGIMGVNLFDYLREQSKEIDIFCFQEVFDSPNPTSEKGKKGEYFQLKKKLKEVLPDFDVFYREQLYGLSLSSEVVDFSLSYGIAICVRKSIVDRFFLDEGDIMLVGAKGTCEPFANRPTDRNLQYLRLNFGDKILNIINIHGVWIRDAGKSDNNIRLAQSAKILKLLKELDGEVILTGDFNLDPDTQSIKMLEDYGLNNLIKINKITTTRSSEYSKTLEYKVGDKIVKNDGDKFADYTFTSDCINVVNYQVPPVEVSDHRPLILDFELK